MNIDEVQEELVDEVQQSDLPSDEGTEPEDTEIDENELQESEQDESQLLLLLLELLELHSLGG